MRLRLPTFLLRADLREPRFAREPINLEVFLRRSILAWLGIQGVIAAMLLVDMGVVRIVRPMLSVLWSIIWRLLFVAGLAFISIPTPFAEAAACIKGVNCYCDRVEGGDLNDTAVLLCEDFEAPTLLSSSGVGNGAPYFGPWYDATGLSGDRGHNSYWNQKYNNGVSQNTWNNGEPGGTPTFGANCTFSPCTGMKVWDVTNRWNANGLQPVAAILTDNDFDDEIGTILPPSGKAGGGSGAFDGAASYAHRNPPGLGNEKGIEGRKNWSAQATFGITMAMAFPNNLLSDTVVKDAWKFNEWPQNNGENGGDGLFGFGFSGGYGSYFPFYGFLTNKNSGGFTVTQCETAKAAATITRGTFTCQSIDSGNPSAPTNFIWFPTNYTHSTDWPLGTWGCMRGFYQNMGTSNSAWSIKFTGPSGTEQTVVDISNMDTTGFKPGQAPNGYAGFVWNNFANANQGGSPATVLTFRYEDNVHIRAGAPVSCAQIGFSSSGGGGSTSATNTRTTWHSVSMVSRLLLLGSLSSGIPWFAMVVARVCAKRRAKKVET
jgi:hypothetical protein